MQSKIQSPKKKKRERAEREKREKRCEKEALQLLRRRKGKCYPDTTRGECRGRRARGERRKEAPPLPQPGARTHPFFSFKRQAQKIWQ
jgi:type II secretory pathway pseudopilin PulG